MKGLEQPELILDSPNCDLGPTSPSRRSLPSAVRISILAILCAVGVFSGGFIWFASHVSRLATPEDPATADAIIVLTGGQARLNAALHLLKSGKGQRLLISGVHPRAGLEQLRAVTGGDKTLFTCCVDIDHAALDTIGNAQESAKWVESHAYQSVILVTNNYHMPRSMLEMGRLMRAADLRPYPVVNTQLGDGAWMTKPGALRVLFMEYTKYLASLARGIMHAQPVAEEITVVNAPAAAG